MTETTAYPIAEGFPDGFRCATCHRDIENGQPYAAHLVGMLARDVVTVLTCVYCPAPEEDR